jgi:hypothetical protein
VAIVRADLIAPYHIRKLEADFDPERYGYKKLSELVEAIGVFDIDRVDKRVFIKDGRGGKMALAGGGLAVSG